MMQMVTPKGRIRADKGAERARSRSRNRKDKGKGKGKTQKGGAQAAAAANPRKHASGSDNTGLHTKVGKKSSCFAYNSGSCGFNKCKMLRLCQICLSDQHPRNACPARKTA